MRAIGLRHPQRQKSAGAVSLLLRLGGCAAAGPASAAAAAGAIPIVAAPMIAEAALYRSATGYRCWSVCADGTRCNPDTQLCEPIPCGGRCTSVRQCDLSMRPPQCVSSAGVLKIWRGREGPGSEVRQQQAEMAGAP
jgi:hypothetical protein